MTKQVMINSFRRPVMNARHLMDWLVEKENVVAKKLAGLQVRKNYRVLKEPSRAQIDKSCALADHARLSCRMLAFRMSNRFPAASCLPVSDDQHCCPVVKERPLPTTGSLTVSVDPGKVSRPRRGWL